MPPGAEALELVLMVAIAPVPPLVLPPLAILLLVPPLLPVPRDNSLDYVGPPNKLGRDEASTRREEVARATVQAADSRWPTARCRPFPSSVATLAAMG